MWLRRRDQRGGGTPRPAGSRTTAACGGRRTARRRPDAVTSPPRGHGRAPVRSVLGTFFCMNGAWPRRVRMTEAAGPRAPADPGVHRVEVVDGSRVAPASTVLEVGRDTPSRASRPRRSSPHPLPLRRPGSRLRSGASRANYLRDLDSALIYAQYLLAMRMNEQFAGGRLRSAGGSRTREVIAPRSRRLPLPLAALRLAATSFTGSAGTASADPGHRYHEDARTITLTDPRVPARHRQAALPDQRPPRRPYGAGHHEHRRHRLHGPERPGHRDRPYARPPGPTACSRCRSPPPTRRPRSR